MSSKRFKYGEINTPLLTRAVQALIKHHNEQETSEGKQKLLGNESNVNVEFGLLRIPGNSSAKPIRIGIPHPLHQVDNNANSNNSTETEDEDEYLEAANVCIIVKEQSKPWVQEMVEKFPSELGCVKKVLGLDSLRKKFGRFDQKRELLSKYDLFMADDRILPMLGKALGKKFFDAKKHPIPIKLTRKEALPFAVQNCLKATFMYIPSGRCVSVRAGNTAMPLDYLVENCKSVAQEAALKLPNKWKNIMKISIKTSESVSLPFYNMTPDELMEASKLVADESKNVEESKKRSRTVNDVDAEEQKMKEMEAEKKRLKLEKKRKEKEALKSPLLQALKKQKTIEAEANEAAKETSLSEKTPSKKEKEKELASTNKKKKRSNSDLKSEEKTKKKTLKKEKTKGTTVSKDDVSDESKSSKKEYIRSKKFQGAKKGFVFKMGKNGLGYYPDIIPVVDKSLIASLSKRTQNRGRSKSQGRKSGRRGR